MRVREVFRVYLQKSILLVFMLGAASGFPLLLTGSTLAARMTEGGIDIRTIGLFALMGLPYTLKFLVSPFIDAVHISALWGNRTHLAHRKSWCVLSQILLVCSIAGLALCPPAPGRLYLFGGLALLTASFSAIQDIVIDALRIELVRRDDQGAASAAYTAGYRVGMLLAGAGAFVMASYLPWQTVYMAAAALMALAIPVTLSVGRLEGAEERAAEGDKSADADAGGGYHKWIYGAVIAPVRDFFGRPSALTVLAFVGLFKLGEALAGTLSMPFYLALGFTKIEIAAVSKVLGVIATIFGAFVGGLLVKRMTTVRALVLCGILQIVTNFVFVWLSFVGHSVPALTAAIVADNISGGMGTAAFVAFLSGLCSVRFTATQYALLSSFSSIGRTLFSGCAGFLVAGLGWSGFYTLAALLGIPGMLLLIKLPKGAQNQS